MAWRDARHNFSRLFLYVASLITGIAAVVSLDSLNNSLQNDIDSNAKELLGADLVVNGDRPFDSTLVAAFNKREMSQASSADMASMVLFLHNGQSRLIRLVALEGEFPFYGEIETLPENAYELVKGKGYAMMDETLATQFEVSSDDSIKIGNSTLKVAGVVNKIPGGGGIMATFTPSVYISMADLDSTGLVQYGSRVNYKKYFKTETQAQLDSAVNELKPTLRSKGYNLETVESRKEGLGRGFQSIYRFFALLASQQQRQISFDYVTALRDAKLYIADHGSPEPDLWAPFMIFGMQ